LKMKIFPSPDGMDGGMNFWNTQTIRCFLENPSGEA
jgi:hypothetical protein